MINNEHAPLLTPKQPSFSTGWNMMDKNSIVDNSGNCSKNSVTISAFEARWLIPIWMKRNVGEAIFWPNLYACWYATSLSLNVVLVHSF